MKLECHENTHYSRTNGGIMIHYRCIKANRDLYNINIAAANNNSSKFDEIFAFSNLCFTHTLTHETDTNKTRKSWSDKKQNEKRKKMGR